jgi:hypothetical protein
MRVGVVRGEGAVGVPLRRLFRYEWMDVSAPSLAGVWSTATKQGYKAKIARHDVHVTDRQRNQKCVILMLQATSLQRNV